MGKCGFIYFMCNQHNNALYIGVTNDLARRVAEHKAQIHEGFTYKYNCNKLVYFEQYDILLDAIAREKQIKNWKREWKNELVQKDNPDWNDLSESIGINDELVNLIRNHSLKFADQGYNEKI